MDRIVPTVDAVVPFVWVRGASPEDVVRATRAHGAVEEIHRLHEEDGRTLYRVVWNRAFRDAVVHIAESDLAVLSGSGTAEEWRFEFRSEEKAPLSAFLTELRECGVPFTLAEVTEGERRGGREGLTAAQFEALRSAHASGYFEEPRGTSLDDLATEAGVTRQAFGGRLRRALAALAAAEVDAAAE
jgi:predicted DNA binding protein